MCASFLLFWLSSRKPILRAYYQESSPTLYRRRLLRLNERTMPLFFSFSSTSSSTDKSYFFLLLSSRRRKRKSWLRRKKNLRRPPNPTLCDPIFPQIPIGWLDGPWKEVETTHRPTNTIRWQPSGFALTLPPPSSLSLSLSLSWSLSDLFGDYVPPSFSPYLLYLYFYFLLLRLFWIVSTLCLHTKESIAARLGFKDFGSSFNFGHFYYPASRLLCHSSISYPRPTNLFDKSPLLINNWFNISDAVINSTSPVASTKNALADYTAIKQVLAQINGTAVLPCKITDLGTGTVSICHLNYAPFYPRLSLPTRIKSSRDDNIMKAVR